MQAVGGAVAQSLKASNLVMPPYSEAGLRALDNVKGDNNVL